jgi:hypothetical protein
MRTRILAAAIAITALAGCDAAPTAVKAPTTAPRRTLTNQPPVAVITYTRRPIFGGMRYSLNSSGSYDPDGTIDSRFWANNCYPQPESNQVTTTIDVATGSSCSVTLELWDNEGAFGSQEVILSN